MCRFFLGTGEVHWLWEQPLPGPLFVSERRLRRLCRGSGRSKSPPGVTPACDWAMDSGAFTELSMHGRWTSTAPEYAARVCWWNSRITNLLWVAPQDWMCEPEMIARTGLSVIEHQSRTVENFLTLRNLLGPLVIPVIQGYTLREYRDCMEMYADAGVNLSDESLVGIGSVCRRQHSAEIEEIVRYVHSFGIRLHGFGVKTLGLARYAECLVSCDSMAWEIDAQYSPPLAGCTHADCRHCHRLARVWRARLLSNVRGVYI